LYFCNTNSRSLGMRQDGKFSAFVYLLVILAMVFCAALNFGPKLGGSYTCMGINPTNGASIPMLGVAVVVIHPLPTTFFGGSFRPSMP